MRIFGHMDQLFGTVRAKMLPITSYENIVKQRISGHSRDFSEIGRVRVRVTRTTSERRMGGSYMYIM